jgi:hypothetical protein
VGFSRAIPSAIRPVVREQIKQMIEDDIIEISDSPFINPLTVVYKEDKRVRLCGDARKINQITISDRTHTTIQELLVSIRALKQVLGEGIESFIVLYVDDGSLWIGTYQNFTALNDYLVSH